MIIIIFIIIATTTTTTTTTTALTPPKVWDKTVFDSGVMTLESKCITV